MRFHSALPALSPPAAGLQTELAATLISVRAVLEDQRSLARTMQAGRDPKRWYLLLCQFSTEALIRRYEQGQLIHPHRVLQLVPLLHDQFLHNLRRWLSPGLGSVEPHWQSAFTAFDLASEAWSVGSVLTALHLALRAQLEQDLPKAVAQLLGRAPSDDLVGLRADLSQLSHALRSAVERLLMETTAPHLPHRLARPGSWLLAETLAFLLQRYVYDEVRQRSRAFERGAQLASRVRPATAQALLPGQLYVTKSDAPTPPSAHPLGAEPSRKSAAQKITSWSQPACGSVPRSELDAA